MLNSCCGMNYECLLNIEKMKRIKKSATNVNLQTSLYLAIIFFDKNDLSIYFLLFITDIRLIFFTN